MYDKMTNRAMKTKARIVLRGHYEKFALMVLLYGGILLLCALIPSWAFPSIMRVIPMFYVMATITTYLLQIILSMFSVGLSKAGLNASRETEFNFSDIIYAFRNTSNQFLKLEALLVAINACLSTPVTYLGFFSIISLPVYFLLVLAVAFAGMLITLKIRFARYILMDHPEYTFFKALKESIYITNGNYLRILKLVLSFIPMYLLGVASFAVGFLVVTPYYETSFAVLYDEIRRR